ncbi:MAG TPA: hypothetical protein VLG17_03025 [Pseudomonas sp.]|uniref:hypothetical protein n=1 Tax=Pseudomonas sp. TaxID=306 RepID=UPI002C20A31A|nr:hypothetical protein [Pseudomonas sp.]HSX86955.1 hypothetical protein [Pseudomonas sp.]
MLMNQPTHDETSHTHLHLLDCFKHDEKKWAKNYENMTFFYQERVSPEQHIERKRREWAPDAHLFPKAVASGITYTDDAHYRELAQFSPVGVYMDERRLAQSDKYNKRTGLPEISAVPEMRGNVFYVLQKPVGGKGQPQKFRIPNAAVAAMPPYNNSALYIQDGISGAKVVTGTELLRAATPRIPADPPHSMFPDSEAMVLYLTAALLSDAGVRVLNTLNGMAPGSGLTVGLFSKTAVRVVKTLKNSEKVPDIIERKADVRAGTRSDYLGSFTYESSAIDHVVVAMSKAPDSSVTVVTYYPSHATTGDTIKTPTAADEDVEEHVFGIHQKARQLNPEPVIRW